MMVQIFLLSLGGMMGALSRYLVQQAISKGGFPKATLTVNLLGSFLLGWMVGKGIHDNFYFLGGIGFLGAFTTFSTMNVDLVKLIKSKQTMTATIYFFSTYVGGLFSAAVGLLLGRGM